MAREPPEVDAEVDVTSARASGRGYVVDQGPQIPVKAVLSFGNSYLRKIRESKRLIHFVRHGSADSVLFCDFVEDSMKFAHSKQPWRTTALNLRQDEKIGKENDIFLLRNFGASDLCFEQKMPEIAAV